MGYSLVLKCKSTELRDKILGHLEEHFSPVSDHFSDEPLYVRGPTADLSYDGDLPRELILGFDYHVLGDSDAMHALMVCHWAVLKHQGDVELWYDGTEKWGTPVDINELGIYGIQTYERMTLEEHGEATNKLKVIRQNIELIDRKWSAKND